jgi:hypothetical protein
MEGDKLRDERSKLKDGKSKWIEEKPNEGIMEQMNERGSKWMDGMSKWWDERIKWREQKSKWRDDRNK